MRLLDLFCGAGGAAMGYHRAGFEVVGVDIAPQPRYPFEFVQADALEYLGSLTFLELCQYDAIHASPPCQAYSAARTMHPEKEHPDLVAATRDALEATGLPWVIENVPGSPLRDPVTVCGKSLGLRVKRHRLFESNVSLMAPPCIPHRDVVTVFGGYARTDVKRIRYGSGNGRQLTHRRLDHDEGAAAMECEWMTDGNELSQAIPPAYTELIGSQLLASIPVLLPSAAV